MRKEVKKTTEKYVTETTFQKFFQIFEKKMTAHDEAFSLILKEIRSIHEDNKYFRQSISNLNIDGSSSERKIEDLRARVERLEMQRK